MKCLITIRSLRLRNALTSFACTSIRSTLLRSACSNSMYLSLFRLLACWATSFLMKKTNFWWITHKTSHNMDSQTLVGTCFYKKTNKSLDDKKYKKILEIKKNLGSLDSLFTSITLKKGWKSNTSRKSVEF